MQKGEGYEVAEKRYAALLGEFKKAFGIFSTEKVISSAQGAEIVAGTKKYLNFSTNDYMGMCNNERVREAAKKAIDTHGFGVGSVRLLSGTQDIHKELEKELAAFHSTDDCSLFSSCFDANGAIFDVFLTDKDAILSDELNHASIIDGIRLSKAKRFRYRHLDMADLERALIEAKDCDVKLIATDATFSMDGDIAPLPEIGKLATKYKAMIMIDESHSSGVFGKTGKGVFEYHNMVGKIDIITSTLGKGLGGGSGGFVCSHQTIIDLLRFKGRPYIFSNSLAPPLVGGALEALREQKAHPETLATLKENVKYFRAKMKDAGYELMGHEDCPICPALLCNEKITCDVSEGLRDRGIHAMPICYPVVPKGQARIRITVTASHKKEHLDKFVKDFIEVLAEKTKDIKA